jgi:hypothetical protein
LLRFVVVSGSLYPPVKDSSPGWAVLHERSSYGQVSALQSFAFSADTDDLKLVRFFARNHKIVNQLLLDAKNVWKATKEELISIYSSNSKNEWRLIASRPKRPLSSIVLDLGIKEKILNDAKDFLNSKRWYAERGIPFRRGYLLVRLS